MLSKQTAILLAAALAQCAMAMPVSQVSPESVPADESVSDVSVPADVVPYDAEVCEPQCGLEYVAQKNPFQWTEKTYANFEASGFHTLPAIAESQSPANTKMVGFGGPQGTSQALYGQGSVPIEYTTIQHRGFLVNNSNEGCTYTVTIPGRNDNIALFWKGDNAVNGYSRANADNVVLFQEADQKFDIQLAAGEHIPIRFMFANGFGPGVADISIVGPDGDCFARDGVEPTVNCFYTTLCKNEQQFQPYGRE